MKQLPTHLFARCHEISCFFYWRRPLPVSTPASWSVLFPLQIDNVSDWWRWHGSTSWNPSSRWRLSSSDILVTNWRKSFARKCPKLKNNRLRNLFISNVVKYFKHTETFHPSLEWTWSSLAKFHLLETDHWMCRGPMYWSN